VGNHHFEPLTNRVGGPDLFIKIDQFHQTSRRPPDDIAGPMAMTREDESLKSSPATLQVPFSKSTGLKW
jgi:hypothetical protein